ncbi:hypothetical protein QYE76_055148 [Lolium multiflorum]|uniref:Peptidase C1A papain C-terminal domain-containing protein n=1 Tax=Lolium multiflorum TaxID=4521 RepID=A0AAD8T076_LOLMU|nr:hypothetical protein QYE76_055148 [Lolium multiflorum]
MKAVGVQLVAVSMRPTKDPFQAYKTGTIYQGLCSTYLHHVMLVVGYGVTNDMKMKKYWIVKNTYGPNWGTTVCSSNRESTLMVDFAKYKPKTCFTRSCKELSLAMSPSLLEIGIFVEMRLLRLFLAS